MTKSKKFLKSATVSGLSKVLNEIESVVIDGKVVSISCCKVFDNRFMRAGMNLYTLHPYRNTIRDHMFTENGFFSRHVESARSMNLQSIFLAVYPHTKKLEFHAKNLGIYKRSLSSIAQPYLEELQMIGMFNIKNVDQYVIAYPLKGPSSLEELKVFLNINKL